MNIKLRNYLTVLPLLFLLVACAQLGQLEARDNDSRTMAKTAKTYSDHNNLATYYDKLAQEMAAKAEEKRESLGEYEDHSYYYGRQGQDFKSHTAANIRYYEEAAEDAAKHANFHRKIAAELLQQDYAKSGGKPEHHDNHKIKAKLNSSAEISN